MYFIVVIEIKQDVKKTKLLKKNFIASIINL